MDANMVLLIVLIVLLVASAAFAIFRVKIQKATKLTDEQMMVVENAISEAVDTVNRLYKAKDTDERKRIAIDIAYEKITETGLKIDRAFLEQLMSMVENINFKK